MDNNVKTFTVVDSETQRTKEIQSNATTVAELKRDLRQNGFQVDGKTIQEALTRTEFKDDSSLLPHDVPYKGSTTNNLVFRLTKTNKQVRSGMDRQDVYAEVKRLGLGEAIKAKFGKNFTQVSTNDLVSFIEKNGKGGARPAGKPAETKKEAPVEVKKAPKAEGCNCESYVRNLVEVLIDNGTLCEYDREAIFGSTVEEAAQASDGKQPTYSKSELDSLLGDL